MAAPDDREPGFRAPDFRAARDGYLSALAFFTRLPTSAAASTAPPALGWAPLAGATVGLLSGLAAALALALGLPPLLAAGFALAASVAATGGLHEDGLADTADGLGGGATRERRLEIMRDSRIGAFGALAIGLSLLLRAAAIAEIARRGGAFAALFALAGAGAVSRAAALAPLALLTPVRDDGAGRANGALAPSAWRLALALGAGIGLVAGDLSAPI
ncbi:MAG: adenosylcobinamide-GDP ribazoletransferase, partial [Hyphomicrobiales bacterium]|nr:adenosylcobinamide-GDP ribazoletransferase [Hyphomicrobiales bacterium]